MNPSPPGLHRRRALAAALACLLGCAGAARAQDAALEAGVKAAYLYKFLAYVDWPPSSFARPDAPLVIGVAGADAVNAELQGVLAGRQYNGRPIVARKVAEGDSLEALHVLFIGKGVAQMPAAWAQSRRPVLMISDAPQGLRSGSALNFLLVDGRVRFEASVPAAERSGLKLSARLLAVAERVVAQ